MQIGLSQVPSLRIIADHARATTFLITDGILPANDGRGYVLRKIMRRAIRHGRLLGAEKPFLADMVLAVRDLMGKAYPELLEPSAARVWEICLAEEKCFAHTIDKGLKEWDATRKRFADDFRLSLTRQLAKEFPGEEKNIDRAYLEAASGVGRSLYDFIVEKGGEQRAKVFTSDSDRAYTLPMPGDAAFRLYDTYGLPLHFMIHLAHDSGIEFDQEGFERAMQEQRKRARASWKGGAGKETANPAYAKLAETSKTEPDFYFGTTAKDSRLEAIITKNRAVNHLKAGESGEVVLNRTAIYAESGGQVADTGAIYDNS